MKLSRERLTVIPMDKLIFKPFVVIFKESSSPKIGRNAPYWNGPSQFCTTRCQKTSLRGTRTSATAPRTISNRL